MRIVILTGLFFSLLSAEVVSTETVRENGREIKYKYKDANCETVRSVRYGSDDLIVREIVVIQSNFVDIAIIHKSALTAKTKGNYDIGYSLNKEAQVTSIAVFDKDAQKIVAGYVLKNDGYVPLSDAELMNMNANGVLFDFP